MTNFQSLVTLSIAVLAAFGVSCSSTSSPGGSGGSSQAGGASGGSKTAGTGGAGGGGASSNGGNGGNGGTGGNGGNGGSTAGGSSVSAAGGAARGGSKTGGSSGGGCGAAEMGGSAGGTANSGGATATGGSAGGARTGGSSGPNGGAGAGGGATDGGADAGSDAPDAVVFNPCPTNGDACKILPLGDSITWGQQDEANAGYRGPLFGLAIAAHQKIVFTGSQSNGPNTVAGQPFPKNNEGHSGWPIDPGYGSYGPDGVSELVPTPAFNTMPHIVLLMIGTNDLYSPKGGQAEMPQRLGNLIDKIISTAPNALVVVAQITPWAQYTAVIKTYNDAIPGVVEARANKGKHVVVVDMNTHFDTATMLSSDGCHPNTAGYHFMADQWYAAIKNVLPK
jgi:lysophospholipase L1-like esterase